MAGIGWRLERLIHQGMVGATAAYATGAAVMALPWVLTTAVLVSLRAVIGPGTVNLTAAGMVVNVAYAVALLVAGPFQIVVSRYAADRLFEGRLRAIAAPFCRGLGATILTCLAAAVVALLAMELPLQAALWGAALSAVVGAQWTAMSVGNGLCSPALVLSAVGVGSGLSFVLAALFATILHAGVAGYLFGLMSGQAISLAILLVGIFRALPEEVDERARLLPAFRDYATLAVAGLAFNASLWVDKLVAWCVSGGAAASVHAGASTLAWISTIPCMAWLFVEVETTFHRRFRRFYAALEDGASLAELRRGVKTLEQEADRLLFGALAVQAGSAAFLEIAATALVRWLRLPLEGLLPYRFLLIAAGAQAICLLGLILLYYFDLRREACVAAIALLLGIVAFGAAAAAIGLPLALGTAVGSALGAVATWYGVFRGIRELLPHTLLGQPYGVKTRRRKFER
jgi:uncharacterized membrane protein